jgi:hypothetical protein
MYKLLQETHTGPANFIVRIADNAFIPFDPDNTDYQEYLKWLADGGVPLPPDSQE